MVDPISIFSNYPTNPPEIDHSQIRSKAPSNSQPNLDPRLKLESPAVQDSVQINMNLSGNLKSLQNSFKSVFESVKSQLENYYTITEKNTEDGEKVFTPPEDATGQELLEFFSPKNTADRIVEFATGFVDQFLSNNPDKNNEENIEEFTTLINDAVAKGFDDADAILGDLSQFEDVSNNIEETYQMVLEGIQEFRVEFLKRASVETIDPAAQPDPLEELTEEFLEQNSQNENSETASPQAESADADINPFK